MTEETASPSGFAARQQTVVDWFDRTYATKGLGYLRPPESYRIFLQLLAAEPGRRLLDVGCGPGLLLRAALERGVAATGVDASARALDLARELVPAAEVSLQNAGALDFEDATFDYVTCIGSIERFLDRPRALGEMRRVARDDARFCFMVRNARTPVWRIWRVALGQRNETGHQDALPLEAWSSLFADCGFALDAVHPDQWPRQRLRRLLRGPHDAARPEPVARPWLPLRYANEFVFLLRKAPAG